MPSDSAKDIDEAARPVPVALALGRFDGIHRGHEAVLAALAARKADGLRAVVALYPSRPGESGGALADAAETAGLLRDRGVDAFFSLPAEPADAEVLEALLESLSARLDIRAVAAGRDCRFGRDGLAALRAIGERRGFSVHAVDPVLEGGSPVGASRIREALARGDVEAAERFLGRPYSVSGGVVRGKALGRTVGMPTANLEPAPGKILPARGVYATRVGFGGRDYLGVTHIGPRPSVDDESRVSVETLILDFSGDLYGTRLRLDFLAFLRPVLRLDGIEAVRRQVALDAERARGLAALLPRILR